MKPNLPEPSNPSGCWITDSPLARFLGFWPKTAQARGPTPENRAYQTCSHPRTAPTPSWQHRESPPPGAAQVLSLVFIPTHPKSARRSPPQNQTPCLSNLLPMAQAKAHAKFRATRIRVSREDSYSRRKRPQSRAPNPRSGLNQPQPNPRATTTLLKRPRAGYPTMDAQPVGWESGGHQAHGRSATYPGFG